MIKKLGTGIEGLDSILKGGYLQGSPTIIKGGPGTGKTIITLFFAHAEYSRGNKVLYLSCDEAPDAIIRNMDNFRLGAAAAREEGLLQIMDLRPDFSEEVVGEFTGEYELGSVLLRMQENLSGDNPVVIIDSLQNLLMPGKSRIAEKDIYALFDWSRKHNVTLLVTDVLDSPLTKVGTLEEYASDCVIKLEQQYYQRMMTRYLVVEKMRSSKHGTNKFPFCLTDEGVLLFPVADFNPGRRYEKGRFSTGIKGLDDMIGGGIVESSLAMLSGKTGTAKTLIAVTLAHTLALSGRKVIYVTFEESVHDLIHNVRSIGIDLKPLVDSGMLEIKSTRPSEYGVEYHLLTMIALVKREKPALLVIDPLSALFNVGDADDIKDLVVHFAGLIKEKGTTIFTTELLHGPIENSEIALSSIVDTLIQVRQQEMDGEFYRILKVRKSRGSKTSNQTKEYVISDNGIAIESPYIGASAMKFGSAKRMQMLQDKYEKSLIESELEAVNKLIHICEEPENREVSQVAISRMVQHQNLLEKKLILEKKLNGIREIEELNAKSRN